MKIGWSEILPIAAEPLQLVYVPPGTPADCGPLSDGSTQ